MNKEEAKIFFDDIRPYYDEEIPEAMKRIAESPQFTAIAEFVYPGEDIEEVRKRIANYKTIRDFQLEAMKQVNQRIIESSISDFSYSGFEHLNRDKRYLYISNHRDIMLDSCLLQYALYRNDFETSEITFGANLMINQLVIDIGKSNKMFKVERPGKDMREFYRASKHLSDYIRYVITEKGESIWIAQRNGRTKDGNDATDQGIIKMFSMSKKDDRVASLDELNIAPVAISYEWESCDILKTIELYKSQTGPYVKQPGEDLNSILTGIMQPKGRVHIEMCPPITKEELERLYATRGNDFHKAVAQLIDERILPAYRLYPNNYIAYDLLERSDHYSDKYSEEEKLAFLKHMRQLEEFEKCDTAQLNEIFLGIYANPVKNKI